MTAEPTDADRARAAMVAERLSVTRGVLAQREVIAAALAAARQPFLDLADELDKAAADLGWARGSHYADAANQIRDAAGDPA